VLALAAAAGLPCAWAPAQTPPGPIVSDTAPPAARPGFGPARPASAGRIVKVFDFEERADIQRPDFNPEPVPVQWFRAQAAPPERERPGFPQTNRAEYDLTSAYRGRVSLKLPTSGGSTALRLSTGVLPVFREPDYAVSAYVRTDGLRHARAFVWAQLLNSAGEPIPGSERRSEPVQSPDGWTRVEVVIPGGFPRAAFLQIELQLLQPEQFRGDAQGPHFVASQDLKGAAWFDDVVVLQRPRVELTSGSRVGVLTGASATEPDRPLLRALINDLSGEPLDASLVLQDIDGRELDRLDRRIPAGGAEFSWSPALPRWGWYRAELTLRSGAHTIGQTATQLLWIPGPPGTEPDQLDNARPERRLGVAIPAMASWEHALVPEVVRKAGPGAVTIALPPIGAAETAGPDQLASLRGLLDALLRDRREVKLALTAVEPELARREGLLTGEAVELLSKPEGSWLPALRVVLDQYGQRVQRWQVSLPHAPGDLPPAVPELAGALTRLRETLQRFVPGPVVSVSWRADWVWPASTSMPPGLLGLDLHMPASFPPAAVRSTLTEWTAASGTRAGPATAGGTTTVVVLEPHDAGFGQRAVVADTFQRAVEAWAAFPPGTPLPRLVLPDPWTAVGNVNGGRLEPDARLGLWSTLARHLAGRRVVGTLPSPPGVICRVLADEGSNPDKTGALVLWDQGADPANRRLSTYLGPGPLTEVDAFGNRRQILAADANGLYHLEPTPTPVFIEGIDPELALFLPGLRVEPEFVPAVTAEHRRELVIANPWPMRVTGSVQFVPPAGRAGRNWRFSPVSAMPFSLGPGQTQRLPFAFSFGAAQEAGATGISAIVKLTADRNYGPLRVTIPIAIGLPDLDLVPSIVPSPGPTGPDLTILATVSNTGETVRTLQVSVQAPGRPVQQQPISNLAAKESAVRRFVLPGAAAELSGQRIRVTLLDVDGTERLNKTVNVP
jgi:hypothetical protein